MKRYIKASWNGTFSTKFIMDNSNIDDRKEAKKLSDYLYYKEYDSGFRTREEFLQSFDFDELYDEMLEDKDFLF